MEKVSFVREDVKLGERYLYCNVLYISITCHFEGEGEEGSGGLIRTGFDLLRYNVHILVSLLSENVSF